MARKIRPQRRTIIRGLVVAALGGACLAGVGTAFALGSSMGGTRGPAPLAREDVTLTGPSGTVTLTTPTRPDPPRLTSPSLTLVTSTSSFVAGVPFTLTLTESGGAGGPASTAQISGFGPGLVAQGAGSSQGTCDTVSNQAEVTCALGTVNSGGNVVVNVTVLPVTAGTYTALGNINDIPGSRSISITVNPRTADLGVAAPGATLKPLLGHRVRAGIVVGNAGPFDDTNVTLTVTVPRELRLLAASSSAGTCAGKPLVCHFAVVPMGTKDLVVLSMVAARTGTGHVLATVTGDVAEASAADNSGSIAVSVPGRR